MFFHLIQKKNHYILVDILDIYNHNFLVTKTKLSQNGRSDHILVLLRSSISVNIDNLISILPSIIFLEIFLFICILYSLRNDQIKYVWLGF